jgi:hypothetical protein
MTFVNHCSFQESIYDSLFLFSDVQICFSNSLIDFITGELIKTRFDYEGLENSFETIASMKKIEYDDIQKSWNVIKDHISNFPLNTPNYATIEQGLKPIISHQVQIENILSAIKQLHDISKRALESNVNALELDIDKKVGFVGEILAYLYARDIQNANCLYHKLILDNPNSFRQGLDLMTIIFKDNPDEDEIHFWEAKGTDANFGGQRTKIVHWFNNDRDTPINMAIEAAKFQWKHEYPSFYKRATSALTRYQAGQNSFCFIGSIACDLSIVPSSEAIRKFGDINVDVNNKRFVIFKTEKLLEVVNSVYDKIC